MYEKFDKREYDQFIDKMYPEADTIEIEFDSLISDMSILKGGKFDLFYEYFESSSTKYDNDNPYTSDPYTCVAIRKSYWVYQYLKNIDN